MSANTELIETRIATIERKGRHVLEVRFKPDVKLDVKGIQELLAERIRICPEDARDVLAVFPPDVDFEVNVMTMDHYKGVGLENCTRSLAVAANSAINERFAGLYFAYFPQGFKTRVFSDEADAQRWLSEQAAARAGS